MRITLCGSARFEVGFKRANRELSLRGHVVYSLAVYPSDEHGKDWYTEKQKETLDWVHKAKIHNSDAIFIVTDTRGYIGDSTKSEIEYAAAKGKQAFSLYGFGGPIGEYVKCVGTYDEVK